MDKKNKKKREYLFSGTWEDRLPAILYSCMIVAFYICMIVGYALESTYNIDIPLIVELFAAGIITFLSYKICNKIMKHIIDKKKRNN